MIRDSDPGTFMMSLFASLPVFAILKTLCPLQMVENWVYSLFFCAGELWGGVVISVLFWTLANEVCSVTEAKTIYPLMGISANIALVVAGNYMKWVNKALTQVIYHNLEADIFLLFGTYK